MKSTFSSYINNRKVVLENKAYLNYNVVQINFVLQHDTCVGIAQDSSSGSVMWLIIMNEQLNSIRNNDTYKIIAFTDDIFILIKGKYFFHLKNLVKETLDKVYEWAKKFRFDFNINKYDKSVRKILPSSQSSSLTSIISNMEMKSNVLGS